MVFTHMAKKQSLPFNETKENMNSVTQSILYIYNGGILFQVVEQHTEEESPERVLQTLEEATPARGRGRGKGKGKKTKTPAAKEKVVREITIIIYNYTPKGR